MEGSGSSLFRAWHLPVAVIGIAVPIIGATMLGGPPAGLGAAFLVAATIVYLAVRSTPREAIEVAGADRAGARVLVVAPATGSRLGHWLSDVGPARLGAQERLAVSLAGLATAGIDARGRVGDPDPVMATEDALRTFPAGAVVFVSELEDERAREAAEDVRDRARLPVRHLALGPAVPIS